MASVFKKLIRKELGDHSYNKYFFCYQKLIATKKYDFRRLDNEEIFDDIYGMLKDKDVLVLRKMLERLSDAMFLTLRISKTYVLSFFVYVLAMIFLFIQGLPVWISVTSIFLMTGCFLYKTYEYIINKYCFIDAHIIIVYKSVLDRLLIKHDLEKK